MVMTMMIVIPMMMMALTMIMMMVLLLATMMMRNSGQGMCTGEILQGASKTGGRNWAIFHSLEIHF